MSPNTTTFPDPFDVNVRQDGNLCKSYSFHFHLLFIVPSEYSPIPKHIEAPSMMPRNAYSSMGYGVARDFDLVTDPPLHKGTPSLFPYSHSSQFIKIPS